MSFCMISKAAGSRFSETLTKTCYMLAHTSSFVNTFLQIFTLSIFSRAAKRIARFFDFYAPCMKIFHIFYRTSARAAWKTKRRKTPQPLAFFHFQKSNFCPARARCKARVLSPPSTGPKPRFPLNSILSVLCICFYTLNICARGHPGFSPFFAQAAQGKPVKNASPKIFLLYIFFLFRNRKIFHSLQS